MKIEKRDVLIIVLCAVAGVIILVAAGAHRAVGVGLVVALLAGASSCAAGGVPVCIFRRLIERRHKT
jgi:hypothetical protein